MKFCLSLCIFTFLSLNFSHAQGKLRGKITDEKGEAIFGARVVNKNNLKEGAESDFDGNYTFIVKYKEPVTVLITAAGMDTIIEEVNPINNEIVVRDYTMITWKPKQPGTEIEEVKVVVKMSRTTDNVLDNITLAAASSINMLGAVAMAKSGDPNVTAAVARIAGVSTNGGIITVRGIGDRYIKTMLNGSRIPTLDPLTNNIKLDIFPSSLIDNIMITKTASPDLPGDWAGAFLSVQTKDYPEKALVNIETQIGYNAQATFKDMLTSQRSGTDWLGFDNGLRANANSNFQQPNLNPSTYQEFSALGLQPYFNRLGVTGWTDGSTESNTYFRLGLVELGLLNRAEINDNAAFNAAKNKYNTDFKPQAFEKINPEGTNYTNGFSNNWNTFYRKAPLNFTQNFTVGNQTTFLGKPLGFIVGLRYANAVRYDPNGISQRIGAEEVNFPVEVEDDAQISRQTNNWSSLINLAYRLNENNKVTFIYMPNYMGVNDVANFTSKPDGTVTQEGRVQMSQFYEQRSQNIYQFKSEHFLEQSKSKIESNFSYTRGKSIAPDFKVTQYDFVKEGEVISDYIFSPSAGNGIRRYFRYLNENLLDARLSGEIPLQNTKKFARKIKIGGAYQENTRKSDMDEYYLLDGNNLFKEQLTSGDVDRYLNADKFVMHDQKVDFFYNKTIFLRNYAFGYSKVFSTFAMADYEFTEKLRVSGGLRYEYSKLFSDIDEYAAKGYKNNDIRRENLGGFPTVNAADIRKGNFLPSVNVIYKLKNVEQRQTNLRLNFSQTLARPSIRELNDAAVYDNEFRTLIYGNSSLKLVQIQNYDMRYESYFKRGNNFSVSLFYKDFKNHIEMGFGSAGITWQNIEKSNVKGIELEFKKTIVKSFEVKANATFVQSNSTFIRKDIQIVNGLQIITPLDTVNRPMFGQAPYILNGIINYNNDSLKLNVNISYNIQGPRLVITGVVKGRPDVYEIPRHTLDFKVSKSLGKHFSASISIRDILNAPVRRAYKLPTGWADFDKFRYGTNYNLGIVYKL